MNDDFKFSQLSSWPTSADSTVWFCSDCRQNYRPEHGPHICHSGSSPKDPLMQFLGWTHLKKELQSIVKPFSDAADYIHSNLPDNEQRHLALLNLVLAKDCAVRAALMR